MKAAQPSPFSPRVVLALLVAGGLAFLLTLYLIGAGEVGRGTNDGGGHVGGRGLNGFAALSRLLEHRGWEVMRSRSEAGLQNPGVLVLTPPQAADVEELAAIVEQRRFSGPTLLILPKWMAVPPGRTVKGAKPGWVVIGEDTYPPRWEGFADDVMLATGAATGWRSGALTGPLPKPRLTQSGGGSTRLLPVVTTADGRRLLAATYLPAEAEGADEDEPYPLLMVFEPDLLDNYGMRSANNALLADRLFRELDVEGNGRITFDLTMNGLGRTPNLLTLAFTPPFLAATLCLIVAGLIVGWRAFGRFGPPLAETRRIAFGKRQLVANSAGIVRRAGRIHLLGGPYAALMRARIARLLGVRRGGSLADTDAAIDRLLAARDVDAEAFSSGAARLTTARKPHELLRAAQALKQIERTLER